VFRPGPARKLYDIYHCCVYKEKLLMLDGTAETCRIFPKNEFEESVHLVGFRIRIYHDSRSPEREKSVLRYGDLGGHNPFEFRCPKTQTCSKKINRLQ